jgi:hypothetical protein
MFTRFPSGAVEHAPSITVAAISQVERHPSSHRQAEEEAGAVAVVFGVKAVPFVKIPHRIIARVDLEGGHCEQLACEGKENKSVSVTNLFGDTTKNLGRERQDGRFVFYGRLADNTSHCYCRHSGRRLDHQSFSIKTGLLGNCRAL